ncbi:hypothetical protein [Agitococcus lubricus]|uniref:Alpha/beta hydrolase family protein DUF900 n=1 Tax=Agitococcus lubricus TaxID=1077255 RepID=A0A2T5ISA9_9GAMM|nr:hypothetical protein [Agitococcus lubricus]PTQ86728.1 hypothetical protein C8N29_1337 [Agitococcus lubricus]
MNNKSVLIALHGMGTHTEDSLKKEIVDAANNALRRYPNYESRNIEDSVIIKPIEYNSIFEETRQKISNANQPISQFLKNHDKNLSPHFLSDIVNAEESLGQESNFNTHWLDVILYMTAIGERVRHHVALKLLEIIKEATAQQQNIHLLGHSLGTSVLHDVLWKLYTGGVIDKSGKKHTLDATDNKLRSIWMFANVSVLVSRFSSISPHPLTTIVKPGANSNGCTEIFANIHHKYDPFTIPYAFKVSQNDGWIPPDIWQKDYIDILTEKITRTDTHSLGGYIEDPAVTYPFLSQIIPLGTQKFSPSLTEWQEGNAKIKILLGKENLLTELKNKAKSVKSLSDFIQLGETFQKAIKTQ